jgi:hypothetical protein
MRVNKRFPVLFVLAWLLIQPGRAHAIVGPLFADTTWSGTANVTGDVVVTAGVHLTIAPGTRVIFKARQSSYDDPNGIPNRCDLIVSGRLTVNGGTTQSDSVFFTSGATTPAQGDWGYVYFTPTNGDTTSSITGATFRWGTSNLYLYLTAPRIQHCVFEQASFVGLYADSANSKTQINDCVFQNNHQFGANMIGSSPTMLRCTFRANGSADSTLPQLGGLYQAGCSGRVANCVFQEHTALGTVAFTLVSCFTEVAQDSFIHNTGVSVFIIGTGSVPIDSCYFARGKIGVSAFGAGFVRSCRFEDNYNVAIETVFDPVQTYTLPVIGGSIATACTFRRNAVAVRDSVPGVRAIQARFNDWGTTDEEAVFAQMRGGVDASPWIDSTHTQIFTTTSYGIIDRDVTWSGEMKIRGDIYVMPGHRLLIEPGTVLRMQTPKSDWDSLNIQDGLCDILVGGTITALGGTAQGDSIIVTSASSSPARGDWGGIYFAPGSGGTLSGVLSEYAINGFLIHSSPAISFSTARYDSLEGFKCEFPGGAQLVGCEAYGCTDGLYSVSSSQPTVTNCFFYDNSTGVRIFDSAPTLSGVRITLNTNSGINIQLSAATVRGCSIQDNFWGVQATSAENAVFGTEDEPNDIYGNGYLNMDNASSAPLQARYNYWGTTNEDSVLLGFGGTAVNYSPWYDASHTVLYASSRYGVLASNTTWSGSVNLQGDIVVPAGVTLTIAPGTRIASAELSSAYDDARGTQGVVDLIVEGRLAASGTPESTITFTSGGPYYSTGSWGRIVLLGGSNDSSTIQHATLLYGRGLLVKNASPFVADDSVGAASDTTVIIVGRCPRGTNVGVTAPAGSRGVGVALNDATGALTGWRVTNGNVGVRVAGGAPSLAGWWVYQARTGLLLTDTTSAGVTGTTLQSSLSGAIMMSIAGASRPRVESSVFRTTATGSASATGVKVAEVGTRPDLGGGPTGSTGGNAFVGFDGVSRFALVDSGAVGDTTWAKSAWWGTARSDSVPYYIVDHTDNGALGVVQYLPILTNDPTPAPLWSVETSSATSRGNFIVWHGEPNAEVHVWRAGGGGVWPTDFVTIGQAPTDGTGRGEFLDLTAESGRRYTYALTAESPSDPGSPLVFLTVGGRLDRSSLRVLSARSSGQVRLQVSLPMTGSVTVDAFSADGRRIARIFDGTLAAGEHTLFWKPEVVSGIIWLQMTSLAGNSSARLAVVR